MKYELKNAENTTFKTLVCLIFYIFALMLTMYLFMNRHREAEEILNEIINCLCYPVFREYVLTDNLLYIFNNMYFVLYFAFFYMYEHLCIHNNIATRYNTKKWVLHKYIIGIGIIIIISLIEYGCVFYVFKSSMPKALKYYLYPLVYKILIMSYVYTLYNTLKTSKWLFIVLFLLSFVSLIYFNFVLYIIIILLTFIFNYLFFDLRLFRYKFKKSQNKN